MRKIPRRQLRDMADQEARAAATSLRKASAAAKSGNAARAKYFAGKAAEHADLAREIAPGRPAGTQ
jgi:hypothetical protein